ncbi:MAG: hypothetical protein MJ071_05700 [Oscillospiraceae bacterium]|nr:hypothetical protein [Oscillospiraceae bacterium]
MNVTELMAQVRLEMTGNLQKDMQHLADVAEDVRREPNAEELLEAVAKFAFECMPAEAREQMQEMMMIGDKPMDQAFRAASTLIKEEKLEEAETILKAISDKIEKYYENGDVKYFSFRNPFEYHMYRHFYPDDTVFERAPYDFMQYLIAYGYVLIDNHKMQEAHAVLERAIKFNPISADAYFELAEYCKIGNNMPELLQICRDTLRYCTTADRIARALANVGFYCYMTNDFQSAAVFYFESIRFRPSKAVEYELQDVVRRMNTFGMKFTPPTHGQTIDAYEKYALTKQPNDELVNLALMMANSAHDQQRKDLEGLFLRTAYDLTNNEEIKAQMDALAEKIEAEKNNAEKG